ncbi:MAG: hypothetical protein IT320_27960 [Anaerolineae bacterium]|nr:hypothetical protein [Anaerolineae bacterium]
MLKKIIIAILVVTVVGGAAFAMLDRPAVIAAETLTPAPTAQVTAPEPTRAGVEVAPAGTAQPVQQQQSVNNVGQAWSATGTIAELTAVGMTLALNDGSTVYVELGSTDFWQSQPVPLNIGDVVTVDGFFNSTDYHARTVTNANGATLALRDENGQPLWSGGASNGNGANGGQGEVQVPADEWVTVEGTVTALTNNGLVVQTTDAQTLTVSFGRADFWQTQAVTFAAGDVISMMGFWQADQFQVGQVTKTTTGERILLRDPNGRPLWAGPGRGEGNGSGNNRNGDGNNGNGNSSSAGTGSANGNGGSNGQGNGKSNGNGNGSGSGNQYRGQRQPTTDAQQP